MKLQAILIAAVALAGNPSAAQTQFERSVGAPAGVFSTAELMLIREAKEQNNRDGTGIKVRELYKRAGPAVTRAAQ